jgi:hypothetical protein
MPPVVPLDLGDGRNVARAERVRFAGKYDKQQTED